MSSEKISPPTKPIGKTGGIKQGGNSTITSPMFDSKNGNKQWSGGSESGNILGRK